MERQPIKPIFYDANKKRWPRVKYGSLAAAVTLMGILGAFAISLMVDSRLDSVHSIPSLYSFNNIQPEATSCVNNLNIGWENDPFLSTAKPMDAACFIEQALHDDHIKKMAFLPTHDLSALTSLRNNMAQLDVVFVGGAHLKLADGALIEEEVDNLNTIAKEIHRQRPEGQAILVLDDAWSDLTPEFLSDPVLREKAIHYELNYLTQNQFDGINIQFDNISEANSDDLKDFVQELSSTLAALDLSVSMSISTKIPISDLNGLANSVDYLVLLLNNEHSSKTDAGPLASFGWIQNNLQAITNEIPSNKLVIGLGNYGLDWKAYQTEAIELSFAQAMALAKSANAQISLDPDSGTPSFNYKEKDDTFHTVWFLDAVTLFNQLKLSESIHPLGVALWRLGSEDPSSWSIYQDNNNEASALTLAQINPNQSLSESGKFGSEIFAINQFPQKGIREIVFDQNTGYIAQEHYSKYPLTFNIHGFPINDPKKIVLTFDDGPSNQFTPQILDILHATHTPATFFLLGKNMIKNPAIVKREIAEGHEIGNHTYTHPNMAEITHAQLSMELTTTKRLIESITGRNTRLFRAPFGIDSAPNSLEEVKRNAEIAQMGYYSVGMGVDPRDWEAPGTDNIVQNVLDQIHRGEGNIILFHDGGNDRQQTVDALPQIIAQLRNEGYEFSSLSELMNIDRDILMPIKTPAWYIWLSRITFKIIQISSYFLPLIYFIGLLIVGLRLFGLSTLSLYQKWKSGNAVNVVADQELFSLAVIVPAFNEGTSIINTIQSILAAKRPRRFEIIIVDDGSSDNTLAVLKEHFSNNPLISILSQKNAGKGSALNYGLSQTNADFITILDADTVISPDTLLQLMYPLHDPNVGAVAGNIRVANSTNLLTKWQILEYVTGQSLDRRALSAIDAVVVVPGALGCWRRAALLEAGYFPTDTLAEDADMTIKIKRLGYRIAVAENADAYTEVPETIREFLRQRFRWVYGTYQVVWKHLDAFFRPRYGILGFIALPNLFLIHVILPLIAPLIDLIFISLILAFGLKAAFGYSLGMDDISQLKLIGFYFALFTSIDLMTCLLAFVLEGKEDKRHLLWIIPQRFFYKQLIYFVAFRSIFAALHGREVWWGKMTRKQPLGASQ